jgi:hypothetical protein
LRRDSKLPRRDIENARLEVTGTAPRPEDDAVVSPPAFELAARVREGCQHAQDAMNCARVSDGRLWEAISESGFSTVRFDS